MYTVFLNGWNIGEFPRLTSAEEHLFKCTCCDKTGEIQQKDSLRANSYRGTLLTRNGIGELE